VGVQKICKIKVMTKGTRKIIFFSTVAILIGGGLYYYHLTRKNKVKGKRGDFIVDGYIYTVGSKAQAYPKKIGEFGGKIVESYKDDKNYWLAKNSNAQDILLKKSDVKIV